MNRFGLGEPGGADALGEPGQSILIVDDEPRMRSSLRRLLARTVRDIVESTSGGDAIGLLQRRTVDLVLLDIGLPDVSGLDVMRWIADHRREGSVIIVSGDLQFESAIRALRYGAVEFVRKPRS